MKKIFFLGVGVGFILSGLLLFIFNKNYNIDKSIAKQKINTQSVENKINIETTTGIVNEYNQNNFLDEKIENNKVVSSLEVKNENTIKETEKESELKKQINTLQENKQENNKQKLEKQNEEEIITAPASPFEEKNYIQKNSESLYYVQVITTTSEDECKNLIKRVKEVELTYSQKGDKYIVVSNLVSKDEGLDILSKLEKYKLKGLLKKQGANK